MVCALTNPALCLGQGVVQGHHLRARHAPNELNAFAAAQVNGGKEIKGHDESTLGQIDFNGFDEQQKIKKGLRKSDFPEACYLEGIRTRKGCLKPGSKFFDRLLLWGFQLHLLESICLHLPSSSGQERVFPFAINVASSLQSRSLALCLLFTVSTFDHAVFFRFMDRTIVNYLGNNGDLIIVIIAREINCSFIDKLTGDVIYGVF